MALAGDPHRSLTQPDRLRILHTIAGLWEGTGGPGASVTALCRQLAARGHDVTLLTGAGTLLPAVAALRPQLRVRTVPLGPYRLAHWSRAYATACLEEASRADIVHDHGVWLHTNRSSVVMSGRAGRPVVRSPRGMLSPWALRRSRLLKRLAWAVSERALFARAALIHVTSPLEARDIVNLGIRTPLVTIPNGVDLETEFALSRVVEARSSRGSTSRDRRQILYLSRIHPVKGLDLLQAAWQALPRDLSAELIIAGPGDDTRVAELHGWLASQKGPPARYLGNVGGDIRLELLSSAHLVVLPSYSENYAMVVAEALACGTPVVTTTAMPWAEVPSAGCGWVVEPTSGAVADALRDAIGLSQSARDAMGIRARSFVEEGHSLVHCVTRIEQTYRSVLAGVVSA